MLTIKRTGRIQDVIAAARDVPARVLPYAAASALTRTAKRTQQRIVAQMPKVFDGPTAYTLNSLYTEPANKDKLSARVAIKSKAGNSAVPSERFLYPQVFGGTRRPKRFESGLSYAGVLRTNQWAVTAKASELMDANGNIPSSRIVQLLSYFKGFTEQGYRANMTDKRKSKLAKKGRSAGGFKTINGVEYFVSKGRGRTAHLQPGIYRRRGIHGSDIAPVVIFTTKAPRYRQRLDFTGLARAQVTETFEADFRATAASILAKRR